MPNLAGRPSSVLIQARYPPARRRRRGVSPVDPQNEPFPLIWASGRLPPSGTPQGRYTGLTRPADLPPSLAIERRCAFRVVVFTMEIPRRASFGSGAYLRANGGIVSSLLCRARSMRSCFCTPGKSGRGSISRAAGITGESVFRAEFTMSFSAIMLVLAPAGPWFLFQTWPRGRGGLSRQDRPPKIRPPVRKRPGVITPHRPLIATPPSWKSTPDEMRGGGAARVLLYQNSK